MRSSDESGLPRPSASSHHRKWCKFLRFDSSQDYSQQHSQILVTALVLSAGLFDNALASLGEDGSAALSEDARRRRPVGMVTSDRRRGDARLFSCV